MMMMMTMMMIMMMKKSSQFSKFLLIEVYKFKLGVRDSGKRYSRLPAEESRFSRVFCPAATLVAASAVLQTPS